MRESHAMRDLIESCLCGVARLARTLADKPFRGRLSNDPNDNFDLVQLANRLVKTHLGGARCTKTGVGKHHVSQKM